MRSLVPARTLVFLGLTLALPMAHAVAQEKKQESNSTTEPAPREGFWMKLHEQFLERAKKGDVDLLFLGDSITQGWGNHDKEGHGAVEVWDRHYGPRNAANFGIGGDRTQHVLWRLENGEVDGIKPKVCVLMIGTNNLGSNTNEEIVAGITAIVKKLREKLLETKILLLGIFPRDESPSARRERIAAINEQIAKLAGDKNVNYLDIGKKFVNDDGKISKETMPDSLHLSKRGYRIWADAIEPTLWSMLDEKK